MNLGERIRRWWKPAAWADDHPLSRSERDERIAPTFEDEAAKFGGYRIGGGEADIDPNDELRRPK